MNMKSFAIVSCACVLSSLSLFSQVQTFRYDTDGRLQGVNYGMGDLDYQYDAEGNLLGSIQDQDGDNLSDAFEKIIIDSNPNDAYSDFSDVTAAQDFDGDSVNNGAEYSALSFPADGKTPSLIQLDTGALLGNELTLNMVVLPHQTYIVSIASDLSDWSGSSPTCTINSADVSELTPLAAGYRLKSAETQNVALQLTFTEGAPKQLFLRFEATTN
jgi:YD repeat-containing protein